MNREVYRVAQEESLLIPVLVKAFTSTAQSIFTGSGQDFYQYWLKVTPALDLGAVCFAAPGQRPGWW